MVNTHCKKAVKDELKKLGLHFVITGLSAVDIMENITAEQHDQIRIALFKSGLDMVEREKALLIERTETAIIEMVRYMDELSPADFSDHLSKKLCCDYSVLAAVFSEGRGITIENLINNQKTERIKELIIYEGLSFKEIAAKMHYRTVANLSKQFNKITGLKLTHFREVYSRKRILAADIRAC
jgi:YesN/AraC family two-component response regulator